MCRVRFGILDSAVGLMNSDCLGFSGWDKQVIISPAVVEIRAPTSAKHPGPDDPIIMQLTCNELA